MLAVTLTVTTLISFMFLILGGVIGWLAKQHFYEGTAIAYTHPEMFDENGNIIPDEIVSVRFENDYDDYEDEERDED
jgi:hypothetical protein